MKTPNSTLELGDAIETLVASYVESVRETVEQAVARALVSRNAPKRRSPSTRRAASVKPPATAARRSATELEEVCDALYEQVRAQPGVSMVELAEQLGAGMPSLRRPMSKLKSAGRVRTVGQRHLTRYYPAVARATGNGA